MTRFAVLGISLWAYLATIGLTIAAIIIPEWISWDAQASDGRSEPSLSASASRVHYSYGLHARCDSVSGSCTPFPQYDECHGAEREFCSLWRTVGFLMSAAVVVELAGVVSFAIVLVGGRQKRQSGWRVIAGILGLCAALQAASMGIMVHVHATDGHFFAGWHLAKSFVLATVSWVLQALVVAGITASALLLPEEGGYELIPDRPGAD